ncbi:MAG: hypothetical protein RL660_1550 [Bacteroidota bacterium]
MRAILMQCHTDFSIAAQPNALHIAPRQLLLSRYKHQAPKY